MSWEFHFRNFTQREMWVGAYHLGCGGVPWHDGRPKCWEQTIPHNPQGGSNSVYVPSPWVVDFAQWFQVIIDGLKLIEDVALFIGSEGEDEDALIDALKDLFNVSEDIIKAEAAKANVNLNELAKNAKASLEKTCASIGVSPDKVLQIESQLGLGPNWFFLAGDSYLKNIHADSGPVVDGYGWSVFEAEVNSPSVDRIANHAFVEKGHLIQVIDDEVMDQFWTKF